MAGPLKNTEIFFAASLASFFTPKTPDPFSSHNHGPVRSLLTHEKVIIIILGILFVEIT